MQFKLAAEHDEVFAQALTALAEASTQEPGCRAYQAYRCGSGSFAVLESWTNEAAFEAHRQAAHTLSFKELIAKLIVTKESQELLPIRCR
jgi:quinol monooxygenase YgiN